MPREPRKEKSKKHITLTNLFLFGLVAAVSVILGLLLVSRQEKVDLLNKGKKLVSDNLGSLKNTFGNEADEARRAKERDMDQNANDDPPPPPW